MPEKAPISWEEIRLGSFVHKVIEQGIRSLCTTEKQFIELARQAYNNPEWTIISLEEAIAMLKIFFQRNKNKYNRNSLIEVKLRTNLDDLEFEGYADRIDIHSQGLEIIDYKTGRTFLTAQHRNWQLGLYALGASELGLGTVKRLTLDMLRHEKPLEFEIKEDGIVYDINSPKIQFSLHTIKQELLTTAKNIINCYDNGFRPCPIEEDCKFCNEYVWKV